MLHPTRNNLPESTRAEIIKLLNQSLANAADLFSQVKQAHWNVKGPQFFQLHELFDAIAERVEEQVDDLAERLVQLGGIAEGTVRMAAANSTLPEYPLAIKDSLAHAAEVADRLARHGAGLRQGIDQAAALGDADTADLLTEYSRITDKDLWFVEAHLQ
jgi:starvation-inducible DNA-binding protein